jgi:threonine aldolase
MRQAGIVAAGAVYALDHHVDRLAEDHENAKHLEVGLAGIEGITVDPTETNMVFFDISGLDTTAGKFSELVAERGLGVSTLGGSYVRAVTHLDINRAGIDEALGIIRDVVKNLN